MNDRGTNARLLLERALADVLGEANAAHLRGDSPLLTRAGTGVLAAADAVVIADAVERQGVEAGLLCRLTDEDFVPAGSSLTVAELQSRIEGRIRESSEPTGGMSA